MINAGGIGSFRGYFLNPEALIRWRQSSIKRAETVNNRLNVSVYIVFDKMRRNRTADGFNIEEERKNNENKSSFMMFSTQEKAMSISGFLLLGFIAEQHAKIV